MKFDIMTRECLQRVKTRIPNLINGCIISTKHNNNDDDDDDDCLLL